MRKSLSTNKFKKQLIKSEPMENIFNLKGWNNRKRTEESQRKRTEDALLKSESRYRSYIEATGQIAWATNADGELVEDSPSLRKFSGQTFEEAKGSGWAKTLHPDDLERTLQVWSKAVANKSAYEIEYRMCRHDGIYRNFLARAFPAFSADGRIYEWVGSLIDITERVEAEKVIKDNEKRFRELIESLPQLFWTCRVDGPCDYLSKQWVEYTGIPEAEQLGYRWLEQLHHDDKERTVSEWMEKVKTGESFDIEFRIRRNDSIYHWFKTRAVPMHDADGNITKWFGSNTDIDEIKKAEEKLIDISKNLEKNVDERTKELQSSKRLLEETGRLARVGGWEINLKTNSLYWSETTYKIHEVEPDFIPVLETAINFYAPEAIPVISACIERATKSGEPFDEELELITAKNKRLWVRAVGEAYRENKEIVKIGGMFQDINERKLAEIESQRKSEQLKLLSNEMEIIIDSIPGLVFYKDINNRFIRVNKYMCDTYMMSKKQLEGTNLNVLHSKEEAQAYWEDDLQVIRSRKPKINIDELWVTKTGNRWVSTSKIPNLDEKGEVIGIIGVSMDVTERKLAEEELKKYRDQLEDMVKKRTADLSNVLMEVKETVNVLVSSSNQILAATTQVASGTSETAAAITETSATVEEVQQAARQSAEKAKNVADSAQRVAQVSHNGKKAVDETAEAMNRIREHMDSIAQTVVRLSEQSQSIGGIIASVTEIADQSNLLAVNAAIEAAKAGEQGRGFAVVAQEIKNLAGQSKQATSQVRNILNDVQKATGTAVMATEQGSKAVEAGVKQSARAGEAILILAESINEAVQATTQILASSQQQVVGMDQIGVAMQNINQAGTETAVSMVQSEKSAKNLNDLGQKLKELVERFKE
jgi:PAS domain S-box-containing protein